MALLAVGCAGIGHKRHEISEIASVSNRGVDTLLEGHVLDDAVDAAHLVDDAGSDVAQWRLTSPQTGARVLGGWHFVWRAGGGHAGPARLHCGRNARGSCGVDI